ncbi:TetR/AcrR family transcriptional regulator [Pseudoflavonifractor sp. DSM 107456]|uniref:TetR/AcrR family transcriptional regulator n=2 Tax=Pseudoflavonifractor TaxID=1017280 RepID=A0ABR9RCQ1_9FIRM|nr:MULTISPECIES: TetR/AcrR family transcriptional regulator [Eubacteriales]MBC5731308.1 TetR/AcrR family transcriptional regulator [Pseudoflavonifractor hominis]MBE5056477.1 TetR/AcrR family transcriptional regulator [Pseudoflavonifractor gallinarum]MBS5134235.1 TetR/AcrR family transcriptional regulator [Oscillospiraceae bacterium]MBT9685337.1 TetR family transcriptional regulator [Pseudoflavonifractor sp. MCC625]
MARPPYRAEQRNQIFACFINAASELMENEGMESLTLRRVAKRAGYNSATLYNYFKDLDHLTVYASMKYFEDYNRNLARYLADEQDAFQRFLFMWRFFCASAFRHPHAYYNLFYGKYSGELTEIIHAYYEVFPEELGELDDSVLEMLTCGSLVERNWQMLQPVLEGASLSLEERESMNEIILYCFKELLTQKIQMGDALDNQTLIERQLSYIHVILRR